MDKAYHKKVQRLQLELLKLPIESGGSVRFKIAAQSYRNVEFGHSGEFRGSYVRMRSRSAPYCGNGGPFYVRGSNFEADNRILECNLETWRRIVNAVKEFNKEFMGPWNAVIGMDYDTDEV
jgi:hypothetical protein